MTFSELGLPAALAASAAKAGLTTPKPIQRQAIPGQLAGRDILGVAQTGSGKTAAFGLPILAGLAALDGRADPKTTRALILAPTRELAVQIDTALKSFAGGMRLSTVLVLGGVSRASQVKALARGVDVLIATPGRLKDILDAKQVRLDAARWVVLDEADRMLDMGFIRDVRHIMKATSPKRQTALFSATMPSQVDELAKGLLRDPLRVEVAPQGTTVDAVTQDILLVQTPEKRAALARLLEDPTLKRVIVFTRTKHGADRVVKNLGKDGFHAAAIHGNKSQNARQRALQDFRDGRIRLLVATDIAARGIDVPGVTHVVNFELPDEPETYVHRIGRTGRNGASGAAITLCASDELAKLRAIERLVRKPLMPDDVSDEQVRLAKNASKSRSVNRGARGDNKASVRADGAGSKRRRPRRARRAKPAPQPA